MVLKKKSVPVIFEPPCMLHSTSISSWLGWAWLSLA